jgi:hypothetical protein
MQSLVVSEKHAPEVHCTRWQHQQNCRMQGVSMLLCDADSPALPACDEQCAAAVAILCCRHIMKRQTLAAVLLLVDTRPEACGV